MFRGGQVFVVCPRIDDMQRVYDRLTKLAPEARILSAHGRMAPNELDQVMTQFADADADILLSTNIVESGIDIPSANTMIIHRADMFGLSQLYQLRGRVGRGRQRAYAYSHAIHNDYSALRRVGAGGNANPRYARCGIYTCLVRYGYSRAETCWETSSQAMCGRSGLSCIKRCCVKLLMMPNLARRRC